jgi:hypothetical protein
MKKGFDIISIIFWVVIIFYLDPGGFIVASAESDVDATRTIVFKFGTIAVAYACMVFKYNQNEFKTIKDNILKSYLIIIVIWSLYYFFWFYGLNNINSLSPIKMILRNQRMVGQMLLVFPIAYFASLNLKPFIKLLSWSTIIITIMFLLTVFFKIPLVEFAEMQRGFTFDLTRYFMKGYGIMSFSLPLAIVILMMNFKKDWPIIAAGAFVVIQTFVSIFRRDMVGIVEYIFVIAFFVNYIYKNKPLNFIWRFVNLKSLAGVIVILVVIQISMPNFFLVTWDIIENTYRTAILGENTVGRSEDVRMSLTAQYGIVRAIEENFLLGTGFNNSWFTGEGGAQGFEGSDYIFLAAFGMYGLVGLIIFLPFYVLTIRVIIRLLKLIRDNLNVIQQNLSSLMYPVLVGLAAAAEFGRNILEYPNWFFPIGATIYSTKYWIYFGLLVGSYYQIKKYIIITKLKKYQE